MPSSYKDHLGNEIFLPNNLRRVISLVPSLTELLFDLGLDREIVGVTKYCVHPRDKVKYKTKIGGTKKLDIPLINTLQPQLIIANKEENDKEQIDILRQNHQVWVSDVKSLADALTVIEDLGQLLNLAKKAQELIRQIRTNFSTLKPPLSISKVLYLIWRKPYMSVGTDTFIHDMLDCAGFSNVVQSTRYPVLVPAEIQSLNAQMIMLSSEPFPFAKKHLRELQEICPQAVVKLVDGEMFSWYGSRMLKAPDYFRSLDVDLSK